MAMLRKQGLCVGVVVGVASVVVAVATWYSSDVRNERNQFSHDLDGCKQRLQQVEGDLTTARPAVAELHRCKNKLAEAERELAIASVKLDECEKRCPPPLACTILAKKLATAPEGAPNEMQVDLRGATGDTPRLMLAARVDDLRGKSWWKGDILNSREGVRTGTVHIGVPPPGGNITVVVLRELGPDALVKAPNPIRVREGFDELCEGPSVP